MDEARDPEVPEQFFVVLMPGPADLEKHPSKIFKDAPGRPAHLIGGHPVAVGIPEVGCGHLPVAPVQGKNEPPQEGARSKAPGPGPQPHGADQEPDGLESQLVDHALWLLAAGGGILRHIPQCFPSGGARPEVNYIIQFKPVTLNISI